MRKVNSMLMMIPVLPAIPVTTMLPTISNMTQDSIILRFKATWTDDEQECCKKALAACAVEAIHDNGNQK